MRSVIGPLVTIAIIVAVIIWGMPWFQEVAAPWIANWMASQFR
ncbi:hypothetical protein [Tessaracoccus palaemonis]|nr:hypothetical protein [Tessaracoccus palaemonis]